MGRVRGRPRQSGVPDRGARRLHRHPRDHRCVRPVDDLRPRRRAAEQRLCRAGGDVPGQARRHRPLRARGVAQVPLVHRPGRDVRLLVRLVQRPGDQRPRGGDADPGAVLREHDLAPHRGQLRHQPAHRPGGGRDPDGVALQHLRGPPRGVVRLRDGRDAGGARRGPDVPALRHGRLAQLQHGLGDRLGRRGWAWRSPGCTSWGGRRMASRRWRRSRPSTTTRDRHPQGAAGIRGLLGGGLRPASARAGRHAGHQGGRRRRDVHRLLQDGLRQDRRQRARHGDDPVPHRRAAALDEHRDHGRVAGALRDLAATA